MLNRVIDRLLRRPVVYDSSFFSEAWFKEWAELRMVLAALIESEPKWRTVLDFGCGPGAMIDLMMDRGLDYVGCDYSAEAHQLYQKHYGRNPGRYLASLDDAVAKKNDLLLAFDVLEHMRDEEIAQLINKVRSIPELLFNISRTRGIPGHINIKSDRAWIAYMREQGYRFEDKRTQKLRQIYAQQRPGSPDRWDRNLFLFSRDDSMVDLPKPTHEYFQGQRSEVADLVPGDCIRVLDVGCGYGGLGRHLRGRGVEQVFGVEINPDAVPQLEGVYADYWIGDVEQVTLPADVEAFDCIVFADVLEHLRDPWGTLKRYLQWLKPGGHVVASIPNVRNIALLYNLVLRGRWRYEDSGLLDRTHLRFFTRGEILDLFADAGLEIELIRENREHLSLARRILAAPVLALIPDLGVCQYLIRARRP